MNAPDPLIEALERQYAKRQRVNARYSRRAFARQLGVDSSTLSQILARKRAVGMQLRSRLVGKLELPPEDKDALLTWPLRRTLPSPPPATDYTTLTDEQIEAAASWEFFATLSALEIPRVKGSPRRIAELLGSDVTTIRRCLDTLIQFGYARKHGAAYEACDVALTAPPSLKREHLIKAHLNHIRLIQERLTKSFADPVVNVGQDVTGITVAGDSKRLGEAKEMLRDFRRSMAKFLQGGTVDTVYRLNLQLFPLN